MPDKYIIRRWRKDVNRCHIRVRISYSNWVATPEAQRSDKMKKTFDDIKELTNDSDDKCILCSTQPTPKSHVAMNYDPLPNPSQRILTPLSARGKGRPPSKRKQSKADQKSIESDAICHIDGPPPCRSDHIVATQESNVVVKENMALLLGLSQGGHPNPLYKESEIGNISYPIMHGNYVQGQQYTYWNEGCSMYNMHSSTSRGNDDQELN
ncbi:unnamed protein product [Malus baccata var. baccata]